MNSIILRNLKLYPTNTLFFFILILRFFSNTGFSINIFLFEKFFSINFNCSKCLLVGEAITI